MSRKPCPLQKPVCKRSIVNKKPPFNVQRCPLAPKPKCPLAKPVCPLVPPAPSGCPLGSKPDLPPLPPCTVASCPLSGTPALQPITKPKCPLVDKSRQPQYAPNTPCALTDSPPCPLKLPPVPNFDISPYKCKDFNVDEDELVPECKKVAQKCPFMAMKCEEPCLCCDVPDVDTGPPCPFGPKQIACCCRQPRCPLTRQVSCPAKPRVTCCISPCLPVPPCFSEPPPCSPPICLCSCPPKPPSGCPTPPPIYPPPCPPSNCPLSPPPCKCCCPPRCPTAPAGCPLSSPPCSPAGPMPSTTPCCCTPTPPPPCPLSPPKCPPPPCCPLYPLCCCAPPPLCCCPRPKPTCPPFQCPPAPKLVCPLVPTEKSICPKFIPPSCPVALNNCPLPAPPSSSLCPITGKKSCACSLVPPYETGLAESELPTFHMPNCPQADRPCQVHPPGDPKACPFLPGPCPLTDGDCPVVKITKQKKKKKRIRNKTTVKSASDNRCPKFRCPLAPKPKCPVGPPRCPLSASQNKSQSLNKSLLTPNTIAPSVTPPSHKKSNSKHPLRRNPNYPIASEPDYSLSKCPLIPKANCPTEPEPKCPFAPKPKCPLVSKCPAAPKPPCPLTPPRCPLKPPSPRCPLTCPVESAPCPMFPKGKCPMENLGLCDCEYPIPPCMELLQCGDIQPAPPQYCIKKNCCMGLPTPPTLPPDPEIFGTPHIFKLQDTKPGQEDTKHYIEILSEMPRKEVEAPNERRNPFWSIIKNGKGYERCKVVAEILKKRGPRDDIQTQYDVKDCPLDPATKAALEAKKRDSAALRNND